MNHHYGELGDVWKHLPLAEILRLNPPRHYWETHAGSASYPLTASLPRLHGAYRFMEQAPGQPALRDCAYLQALRAAPGVYPGSPALAIEALAQDAGYIFCDIDPVSAATLRTASGGVDAQVVEGDGVSVIAREARLGRADPAAVLVHIDPFDPVEQLEPEAMTPIELAGWLARAGYRLFYWYCYQGSEHRGWAGKEIARLAPETEVWCGDAIMPVAFIHPGRTGAWGCGVVLANASGDEMRICEVLGQALESIMQSDVVVGAEPDRLQFRVFG